MDAPDISAWFAYMRKNPGVRGKVRSERTIQTYARSVRAFFHWLVRREMIERNPFDRIVFPKVGRPLIQTIEPEEFEQLLQPFLLKMGVMTTQEEGERLAILALADMHALDFSAVWSLLTAWGRVL